MKPEQFLAVLQTSLEQFFDVAKRTKRGEGRFLFVTKHCFLTKGFFDMLFGWIWGSEEGMQQVEWRLHTSH